MKEYQQKQINNIINKWIEYNFKDYYEKITNDYTFNKTSFKEFIYYFDDILENINKEHLTIAYINKYYNKVFNWFVNSSELDTQTKNLLKNINESIKKELCIREITTTKELKEKENEIKIYNNIIEQQQTTLKTQLTTLKDELSSINNCLKVE